MSLSSLSLSTGLLPFERERLDGELSSGFALQALKKMNSGVSAEKVEAPANPLDSFRTLKRAARTPLVGENLPARKKKDAEAGKAPVKEEKKLSEEAGNQVDTADIIASTVFVVDGRESSTSEQFQTSTQRPVETKGSALGKTRAKQVNSSQGPLPSDAPGSTGLEEGADTVSSARLGPAGGNGALNVTA